MLSINHELESLLTELAIIRNDVATIAHRGNAVWCEDILDRLTTIESTIVIILDSIGSNSNE